MNEGALLVFGCAVSFIAAAGAYVFIRERFTAESRPVAVEARDRRRDRRKLRKVA